MKGAGAESSKVWTSKCYSLIYIFFPSLCLTLSRFPSLCSSSANLWLIWASGGAAHWGKWDPVKAERRWESPKQRERKRKRDGRQSLPFTVTLALTSVEVIRNQTPLPSPAWVICVWLHAAQSYVFSLYRLVLHADVKQWLQIFLLQQVNLVYLHLFLYLRLDKNLWFLYPVV